ncbi:hypothetical protein E2C01_073703 [Portunus trituberculatus]|uniref:Uncharacterized protein n=1 Tax=Portunus trituberculatus TaxID=210409 RepID=A0A5B7IB96_PORTR|nr:hypothetical protein [Portunus trituberculatus]
MPEIRLARPSSRTRVVRQRCVTSKVQEPPVNAALVFTTSLATLPPSGLFRLVSEQDLKKRHRNSLGRVEVFVCLSIDMILPRSARSHFPLMCFPSPRPPSPVPPSLSPPPPPPPHSYLPLWRSSLPFLPFSTPRSSFSLSVSFPRVPFCAFLHIPPCQFSYLTSFFLLFLGSTSFIIPSSSSFHIVSSFPYRFSHLFVPK